MQTPPHRLTQHYKEGKKIAPPGSAHGRPTEREGERVTARARGTAREKERFLYVCVISPGSAHREPGHPLGKSPPSSTDWFYFVLLYIHVCYFFVCMVPPEPGVSTRRPRASAREILVLVHRFATHTLQHTRCNTHNAQWYVPPTPSATHTLQHTSCSTHNAQWHEILVLVHRFNWFIYFEYLIFLLMCDTYRIRTRWPRPPAREILTLIHRFGFELGKKVLFTQRVSPRRLGKILKSQICSHLM